MGGRNDWPDQEEWDHWEAALQAAAGQLQAERGVADPWSLTVEYGALWANYGALRERVAGAYADPMSPAQLFEEIDGWVAFDRPAGPGVRLERDREAMAAWRAQLPGLQRLWERAAPRVFQDVVAAAGREVPWRVVVRATETVWPERVLGQGVLGIELDVGEDVVAHERELDFPVVQLELPHAWIHLIPPDDPDDVEGAVADLAASIQDEITMEVHGAWPKCLVHEHPMRPASTGNGPATWECPTDDGVSVPIGPWGPAAAGQWPDPAFPPTT